MYTISSCTEINRITITRCRTGSYNLGVAKGRENDVLRVNRIFRCGNGIPIIEHMKLECRNILIIRRLHNIGPENTSLRTLFDNINYDILADIIRNIEALK